MDNPPFDSLPPRPQNEMTAEAVLRLTKCDLTEGNIKRMVQIIGEGLEDWDSFHADAKAGRPLRGRLPCLDVDVKCHTARALLDSGASISEIDYALVKKLGIPFQSTNMGVL